MAPQARGRGSAVICGLERGHGQVILNGDIEAVIADPAQIERLTLDGPLGHGGELAKQPYLKIGAQGIIGQDDRGDGRELQVSAVGGNADALGAVHARLAAPQLAVIGDVIVDERRALEVLDGRRRGECVGKGAANGLAGKHADQGPVTLARVSRERAQRCVEKGVEVRAIGAAAEVRLHARIDIDLMVLEELCKWVSHGSCTFLGYRQPARQAARIVLHQL